MGLISTPGRGAYAASKYAWRRGQTRCAWSYATAELKSADRTRSHSYSLHRQRQPDAKDKPVENPGIAARFTLGPEAVWTKYAMLLLARSRRCAIR